MPKEIKRQMPPSLTTDVKRWMEEPTLEEYLVEFRSEIPKINKSENSNPQRQNNSSKPKKQY